MFCSSIFRGLPLIAVAVVSALLAGCGGQPKADDGLFPIVVQLDWVAEPEHGGLYQALAKGFFAEEGLRVELIQGGANAFVQQKVATGQAHFGQADSTNTLLAIAEGLPIVNVAAVFQQDPSVLMLHASNPISSFEELNGQTIMARPEWAFLPFLRNKYGIDFQLVPQSFGLGQFIRDPSFIQQGFYIAEPFFLLAEGVTPKFLYAWDAGFDSYTVLIGNRPFLEKHPEQARAFIRAFVRGYLDYLEGDPAPAHQTMLQINPKVTPEFLEFSRRMIIDERLASGPTGDREMVGKLEVERFGIQVQQLEELGILKSGSVDPSQAVFIP
jgi:NitT/TauT family transport system substrate-binding protein